MQSKSHGIDDQFSQIKLDWLTVGRSYEFDLFVKLKGEYVLFCRKNLKLTQQMAERLRNKGRIYVDGRETKMFQAYMEDNIGSIIKDVHKPLQEKSDAVYTVSASLVNDLLESPKAQNISRIRDMVGNQLEYVMKNPGAVNSLMSITEHDYYTYTHSVNVAIYLVGLGKELKLSSQEIQELSLGGMLHDLGKSKISLDIINSTGKLTEEEFKEMQRHPELGVALLKELDAASNMVPQNCYFTILHHHEKQCGGGYPCGMAGNDIHIYGRMCKVCDIFDALSTKRSYKEAMTTFDAIKLMKDKMISELDPEIFERFIGLMVNFSESERRKL
ncbi:MAG: HD-GYP domain-containing protein [Planctomycetes bacterium]|nr:HD-GYP domain-containing protein [Planctomycetota bacterium]